MKKRKSGLLLHVSSLPSKYGIGDFGPEAFRFADFLVQAGQSCWQILPLNPFAPGGNYSPYNPASAFAGNTLFISPELLRRDGLLELKDIRHRPSFANSKVEYKRAALYKRKLFDIAYRRFISSPPADYDNFCFESHLWLDDYSLYAAVCRKYPGRRWTDWPVKIRKRETSALDRAKSQLGENIEKEKFLQFIFYKQYKQLKRYCNQHGIQIIGDIPFYMAHDSADVWCQPELFRLTASGKPRFVGGVPPDAFSRTGQLWGNPVYDWDALQNTKYKWWIVRIKHNLILFDRVRLDHFRGFLAYWQVPADAENAQKGKWIKSSGENFFAQLFKKIPSTSIVAEDLGVITDDVREMINKFNLASMKVLQFAFESVPADNPHCIDNHIPNSIVYTGTHDNNTTTGWFRAEATPSQKKILFRSLGGRPSQTKAHWNLIGLAMSSVAETVIIPAQDILGLDEQARMNRPWRSRGNWQWRILKWQLRFGVAEKLAKLTKNCGRNPV